MKEAWYVVRSKPNKEFSLYEQLKARSIECYFPRIRVKPVNPRSAKIKPYFPAYMFIKCNLDELGINTFKWMPYAQGLVSFGGNPAVVPTNIISGMKKTLGNILKIETTETNSIKPGTNVIITDGPFEGYEGIFDSKLSEHERVKVLLKLIDNKQIPINIDIEQIKTKKKR